MRARFYPRAASLFLAGALAMLAVVGTGGCKRRTATTSTTTTAASVTPSGSVQESPEPAAGASLLELESHLTYGSTWGSDPIATKIAKAAFKTAGEMTGSAARDVAVATRIIASDPRQIVIVLRLRDLRDETKADRKELLDEIYNELAEGLAATDVVTVGVRGASFYGAVGQGTKGIGLRNKSVGTSVSTALLATALRATAAAEGPRKVALGAPIRVGSLEWVAKDAKDRGSNVRSLSGRNLKTAGRFVVIRYQVTNRAKKPLHLSDAPRLIDGTDREFSASPQTEDLLPDGATSLVDVEDLQPDVAAEFSVAYELPASAKDLRVKLRGPELSSPGLIALGL